MRDSRIAQKMAVSLSIMLVLSLAAGADATLIYDEAVSGDLAGSQASPTPIGSLVLGVNTMTGTHIFPDGQSQGDTFEIDLPAGLTIVDISLSISNFITDPGTTAGAAVFQIPPFNVLDSQLFTNDTALSFNGILPLPSDESYAFSLQYTVAEFPNGYDWEWTITTTPEPSSLALVALGGLALLRRRR